MENEILNLQKQLEIIKSKNDITSTPQKESNDEIHDLIKGKEKELLGTQEFQDLSQKIGEENIKAQLSKEASRIRQENIETAEKEFENETRKLRLEYLKEELKKDHTYKMKIIEKEAKYKQMLDKRKKMFGKYGYLYSNNPSKMIEVEDSDGKKYKIPEDFSFSVIVNRIRQLGRNLSKLDRPVIQTIKWIFLIGVGSGIIFLLKKFNII